MNAFTQIVAACQPVAAKPNPVADCNRCEAIRKHLAGVNKASARELADAAGIHSADVRSSLNNDIRAGRVAIVDPGPVQQYRIVKNPPADKRTVKAIAMLTGQGYFISKPMEFAE